MLNANERSIKGYRRGIRKVTASKLPRSLQPVFSINDIFQWIELSESRSSKVADPSFSLKRSSNASPATQNFQAFFCAVRGGLFELCESAHLAILQFAFYPTANGKVRNSVLKRLHLTPSKLIERDSSFKSTFGCFKQLDRAFVVFKAALEAKPTICSADVALHIEADGSLQNSHTTELRIPSDDHCAMLEGGSDFSDDEESVISTADQDLSTKKKIAALFRLNEALLDDLYDFRGALTCTETDCNELSVTPNFVMTESPYENTEGPFKAKSLNNFPVFDEELRQSQAVPVGDSSMSFFGDLLGFVPTQCNTTASVLNQQSQKSVNERLEVDCTSVRTFRSVPFQRALESQTLKEDDCHLKSFTAPKRKSAEGNDCGKRLRLLSHHTGTPTKSQSLITVESQDADSTTDAICQHDYVDAEGQRNGESYDVEREASVIDVSGIASRTKEKEETTNFCNSQADCMKMQKHLQQKQKIQRTLVETEKFDCSEEVTNTKQNSLNPPVTTPNGIRLSEGALRVACMPAVRENVDFT
ncbi:hypothetical protein D918_05707 [Trichuris suis]|nr:hypothetical protein D918_05707 [Trichuris suis]